MTGRSDRSLPPSPDERRIKNEARDWVLRLAHPDEETDAIVEQWERWCARDSRHEAAYRSAERTWRLLASTESARTDEWRQDGPQYPRHRFVGGRTGVTAFVRRPAVRIAATASVLIGIGSLSWLTFMTEEAPSRTFATGIAQARELELQDGSHVFLGAKTEIQVSLADKRREVTMDEGQAFFEVAHDPDRPFIVQSGDAEIRVVGTKFDVWRHGDKLRVSVLEGRVEVRRRGAPSLGQPSAPEEVLTAGLATQVTAGGGVEAARPIGPDAPGSWREGRLFYARMPLADVVADANRYSAHPIRLADDEVGRLLVTASFRTAAVGEFISGLQGSLPVRIETGPDGAKTIASRQR